MLNGNIREIIKSKLTNRGIWWKDFSIKNIVKNNPDKKFLIWQEIEHYQDCPQIKRHCNDNIKKCLMNIHLMFWLLTTFQNG